MQYFGMTDQGLRRESNQDAFFINIAGNFLIATVCDGMGGANAGNVASQIGIETYAKKLAKYINSAIKFMYEDNIPELGKPFPEYRNMPINDFISRSVEIANAKVFTEAEKNPDYEGMGTTLCSCVVTPKGIITSNIGDSRAYYINDSKIIKLTKDHSYVQDLIDTGKITEDEAMYHPNRNVIMRALGVDEEVSADIEEFPYTKGYILICSDGLSNYIDNDFFINTVESKHGLKYKVTLLIDYAKECGGADNITAVLIKL